MNAAPSSAATWGSLLQAAGLVDEVAGLAEHVEHWGEVHVDPGGLYVEGSADACAVCECQTIRAHADLTLGQHALLAAVADLACLPGR